jgi:hypothetical protein
MEEGEEELAKKMKEITIKFKVPDLKKVGYVALIVVLVAIIILQYFVPIGPYANPKNTTEEIIVPIEVEVEPVVEVVVEPVVEEPVVEVVVEEEEDTLLPLTGDVDITIDKINIDPKPNIEDYARITYVKFTITNQDEDFNPKVVGYVLGEIDDKKDVTYSELEAGTESTVTETKFTFGYSDVDEEHTFKLEIYDEKNKMVASTTKTF